MTFSFLIFAWRNPNLSPAEFKSYYENNHVPLVKSLAGSTFPISHVRRYLDRTQTDAPSADGGVNANYPASVLIGKPTDFEYDVIAELTFEDEAHFQAFMAIVGQREAAAKIEKDNSYFLDSEKMRVVVVGDITVMKRD